jgi:hypothetical protein
VAICTQQFHAGSPEIAVPSDFFPEPVCQHIFIPFFDFPMIKEGSLNAEQQVTLGAIIRLGDSLIKSLAQPLTQQINFLP